MTTPTAIIDVPIAALQPDPHNRSVDVDKQLRNSIASIGVQIPLQVRQHLSERDTYEIVAGERRWRAAHDVGLETVPCIMFAGSEGERIVAQAIENLMRQDFTAVEEGQVFLRAVEADIDIKELASRLGYSAAFVKRRIALLDLPAEALRKLDEGEWTISDADEAAKHVNNEDLMAWILKQHTTPWHPLADQILKRVANRKRQDLIAKRTDELTAAGHRVCVGDHFQIWSNETALEHLDIDVNDHDDEPCHAIGLKVPHGTMDLTEIPCCTDTSRHAPDSDSGSAIQSPAVATESRPGPSPAQLKQQRQRHKAAEARRQILQDTKTHGAAFTDLLALHIVATDWDCRPDELCKWLNIATLPEGETEPPWEFWESALEDHIATRGSKALRDAAVAIIALTDSFAGHGRARHRLDHADTLKRLGWTPAKVDRAIITDLETELAEKAERDEKAQAEKAEATEAESEASADAA